MQLSNLVLRLGGSQLHTVVKTDCTPAEILVLRHIHGEDAVTNVRPTREDKTRRHQAEFERLQHKYDRASTFVAKPGDEHKSVMASLFPGAIKRLPLTLDDIGMGHLMSPASIAAADGAYVSVSTPAEGEEVELDAPKPEEDEGTRDEQAPGGFGGFGAGNLADA